MPWFKVDDGLHGHPKAIEAGLEAMGLWVLMGSHCGFYVGQRGRVSRFAALRVAGSARVLNRCSSRLVNAGLWTVDGDGWAFHEWEVYQPTPESLEAERTRKAAAGRLGAAARATSRRPAGDTSSTRIVHDDDSDRARRRLRSCTTTTPIVHDDDTTRASQRRYFDEKPTATSDSSISKDSIQVQQLLSSRQADVPGTDTARARVSRPVPSRPVPILRDLSPASPSSAPPAPSTEPARAARKKPSVALPAGFVVSAAVEAMCRAEGLPDPHEVLPDFRDWALGDEVRKADWEATFRRWMRDDRTRRRYAAWRAPLAPLATSAPAEADGFAPPTPEERAELEVKLRNLVDGRRYDPSAPVPAKVTDDPTPAQIARHEAQKAQQLRALREAFPDEVMPAGGRS